jgi:predicted dehydrogenase
VRVGVVGTGSFGRNHVRILSELPEADLVGIYDRDPAVAAGLASEHGTRAMESLESLAETCDAIVLAVPTAQHAEVGRRLLAFDLDLLVEKPIAGSLAEADRLLEAAEGQVLAVGHVEFYNPAVQRLLALGLVPGYVEIQRRAGFTQRSLDIDVVLDLMIHDLQILHDLDGSAIREIRATGIPVLSNRTDIANVRIAFESGMVASLTASRVSAERDRKLRAFFQNRYYSLDYEQQRIKGFRLSDDSGSRQIQPDDLEVVSGEPLRLELQAFIQRCRGEAVALADGQRGRQALATALAITDAITAATAAPHGGGA